MRGTRELSGPGFTEAAGVGVLRRHKAGFEAEIQGSRKQDMCDAFDRSNAIYPVHTSLEKKHCRIKLELVVFRHRSFRRCLNTA